MKKTTLLLLSFGCGAALANPVVYLPYGTDAAGTLDGTWNAYERDTTNREWDASRYNATQQTFQPTYGTQLLPQGQLFGPAKAGNMVAITSAAENNAMLQITPGNVFIGLTDATGVSGQPDAANLGALGTFESGGGGGAIAAGGGDPGFRWVTGESAAYLNWSGPGEPNDFNGVEDATELGGGAWNDIAAGATLGQAGGGLGTVIEYRVNVPASIITTIDAWKTTYYKSGSTLIDSPAAADALIAGFDQAGSATSYYTHMNMTGNGGEGNFGGDLGVFGTNGGDTEDYAVLSTGYLVITEANTYQFSTSSDDGARMRLDTNRDGIFDFELNDDVLQGQLPPDFSAVINLVPGLYPIEYRWWERGGGDGAELAASKGGGSFIILGNDEGGGLNVVQIPEPATASFGALAILGLLARRRRA